jgi:hypothetical protein
MVTFRILGNSTQKASVLLSSMERPYAGSTMGGSRVRSAWGVSIQESHESLTLRGIHIVRKRNQTPTKCMKECIEAQNRDMDGARTQAEVFRILTSPPRGELGEGDVGSRRTSDIGCVQLYANHFLQGITITRLSLVISDSFIKS